MQARSLETRAQILAAARDLFAQVGYEAAGVAEICAAAGVSKGAFYHHFPSKQAVFLAVLQEWLEGLDRRLQAVRADARTVPEGLIAMAGMTGEVFQAARGRLPLFLEFWLQASRQPAIWQATIAPYHRYQELFSAIIQDGVNEGSLSAEVDPSTLARVVMGLAMGLLLQALFDPNGAPWPQVAQEGIKILMEGLKRQ